MISPLCSSPLKSNFSGFYPRIKSSNPIKNSVSFCGFAVCRPDALNGDTFNGNALKKEEAEGQLKRRKLKTGMAALSLESSDGHTLGEVVLKENEYSLPTFKKQVQDDLKPYFDDCLYVQRFMSFDRNTKGVGTRLFKGAIKESIAKGHGGRLALLACDPKDPTNAPTIFYHKMGMRFLDEEKERRYTELEKNGNVDTKHCYDASINIGSMYLPEENIEKALGA